MELLEAVRETIATELGADLDKITADSLLVEDLGADSLDVVSLTLAFEEKYNITIEDEVASKLKTVKDIVNLLSSLGVH